MVGLNKNLKDVSPEERIKLLQRLKELDEEKLKQLEEQKKKEIEELKNKSKKLEEQLSEEIKDSVEELTEMESRKNINKKENNIQKMIAQQNAIKGLNYDSLVDKIKSENISDKSNAYNFIKDVTQHSENLPEQERLNYSSLQKIKSVVDKMNEENDEFGYKKRMNSILDQAFEKIKTYQGDY